MSLDAVQPLERARLSLEGLSVGDALGQAFFVDRTEPVERLLAERLLPDAPWRLSDDTVMACAILRVLEAHQAVNQDRLAQEFSEAFARDRKRGYGAVAYWLLYQLGEGRPWREVSREIFRGQGSMGNGGAMRVAPLGAFFAGDLDRVVQQAKASAEVTHAHPEGQAGAVAVAVAAALAVDGSLSAEALLEAVAARTPPGVTRDGVTRSLELLDEDPVAAAERLGDGSKVLASDTVPFALWCAATCPGDFEAAIWRAMAGLRSPESDRDTVLAIVGGVVALSAGTGCIPQDWLVCRESLEQL